MTGMHTHLKKKITARETAIDVLIDIDCKSRLSLWLNWRGPISKTKGRGSDESTAAKVEAKAQVETEDENEESINRLERIAETILARDLVRSVTSKLLVIPSRPTVDNALVLRMLQ